MERVRSCVPMPHDAVQEFQALYSVTTQSTAHAAALQPRVSSRYGHT